MSTISSNHLNEAGCLPAEVTDRLEQLNERIVREDVVAYQGPIRVGVDLGTANVVLVVLNSDNEPIAACSEYSHVVRDGIVVDFLGASRLLRDMKLRLEKTLGRTLENASCAIPPGVHPGSIRVIKNVLESAEFTVDTVIDEPEAAAKALGIRSGAVVDVGGGTTGISILENGRSVFSADEATGGTHMTLVISGAMGLPFEEAEAYKLQHKEDPYVFPIIRPVIEKMATISKSFISGREVDQIYVVGGACSFPEFEKVFQTIVGVPVVKPIHPLLVTPLGIAMSCKEY